MSYRTLIEINHDKHDELTSSEFLADLGRYIRSADRQSADALRHFGAQVIGMRHHADKFIIDADADGFPPQYLKVKPNGTAAAVQAVA